MDKLGENRLKGGGIHFIMGMSRSGTSWMSRNLNAHPNIVSFGELKFWGSNYIKPNNNGRYSDKQLLELADMYSNMKVVPDGNGFGALKPSTLNDWKNEIPKIGPEFLSTLKIII